MTLNSNSSLSDRNARIGEASVGISACNSSLHTTARRLNVGVHPHVRAHRGCELVRWFGAAVEDRGLEGSKVVVMADAQQLGEDVVLGPVVAVQRGRGDTRGLGEIPDRRAVEAVLGEQGERGGEDGATGAVGR